MGATLNFNQERNRWKLGGMIKHDVTSPIVGGLSRAIAAEQLCKEGFSGVFAVTGGTQVDQDSKSTESRAEVLADAISQRTALYGNKVISIGTAGNGNTLGNVTDTINFLERQAGHKELGLLTNDWHMLRSLLIFLADPYFDNNGIHIRPIIADELLPRRNPLYTQWVDAFNSHEQMEKRLIKEIEGIEAFLRGDYTPRSS